MIKLTEQERDKLIKEEERKNNIVSSMNYKEMYQLEKMTIQQKQLVECAFEVIKASEPEDKYIQTNMMGVGEHLDVNPFKLLCNFEKIFPNIFISYQFNKEFKKKKFWHYLTRSAQVFLIVILIYIVSK